MFIRSLNPLSQPTRQTGGFECPRMIRVGVWRRTLMALLNLSIIMSIIMSVMMSLSVAHAQDHTREIVILGDSLVAGYGLRPDEGFVPRLQNRLDAALGTGKVRLVNAGVSGDTSAGGLSRLDWSIPPSAHAVIVSLGGNDALRAIPPDVTEHNLARIIETLQSRDLPVLLIGMRAPLNLGSEYGRAFDAIYGRLAQNYNVSLYPFFLESVAADPSLNQADGIHPNGAGVEKIVARMHPLILDFTKTIP